MAKEDVQVIYEEADDEYWMKPLREAITLTGASVANAVVRQQHYGQQMAESAAKRAHEAYIAQMGIRSSEKVAGMKLGAEVARHKILDKQHNQTMKINKRREDRQDMIFARDNKWHQNDINATAAADELMRSAEEFIIDGSDNIATNRLKPRDLAHLRSVIAKSPEIARIYNPLIQNYNQRQDNIAGRLQMLKMIQKTHGDGALSQILDTTDPINISNLKGSKADFQNGKGGWGNLQALARKVTNDDTWAYILKSYNIDKETLKSMPKHMHEGITDWGWMLTNNNLESEVERYKGTSLQLGMLKAYKENIDQFQTGTEKNTQFADALLAEVGKKALDEAQRDKIGNTNTLLNSGIVEFMHRTNGVFTSPTSLPSSIMQEVSRLVQNPDSAKTDLDKKLLSIANGDFTQDQADVKVQEVIEEFITKNRYIQNGEYKSILGIKKNDYKKTLASYGGSSQQPAVTPPPAEVVDGTTELRLQPDQNNPSVSKPATLKDIAVAYDNETMHDYHYGGKLYGADGKVLIEDGKIRMDDGSYTDISDPQIATKYWFDQNPEIANSEIGKKLQGKIKWKKGEVAKLTEKIHTVPGKGDTKYSKLDILEGKAGVDAFNRMFIQGKGPVNRQAVDKMKTEQDILRDMYSFNRNTAMEVLLANHQSGEMPLFTQNADGQLVPGLWFNALNAKSASTGAVIDVDTHKILEEFENTATNDAQYEGHQRVAKQLRAILKAMNMSDQSNIVGDEFGVSAQLRLLAQEIVQAGGMPKFRYAKVGTQAQSDATAQIGNP